MTNLAISVIVCTRNRAASLRRMLDSATALKIPQDLSWEFIVVDNGSTDDTAAVVVSFADRLPVRCVVETDPGLSNARNRGVDECRGDLVIWTDDDVIMDPEWLSAYDDAAKLYPDAGFFGGNITPILEEPTSLLFAKNFQHPVLETLMARRSYAEPPSTLTYEQLPFGANFAVRKSWQRKHLFDPRLGVSPRHNRSGEETHFLHEIMKKGAQGVSVPASKVSHFIPASRQTASYVRRYAAAQGETWALIRCQPDFALSSEGVPRSSLMFGKIPFWALRNAVRSGLGSHLALLTGNDATWLSHVSEYEHQKAVISYMIKC